MLPGFLKLFPLKVADGCLMIGSDGFKMCAKLCGFNGLSFQLSRSASSMNSAPSPRDFAKSLTFSFTWKLMRGSSCLLKDPTSNGEMGSAPGDERRLGPAMGNKRDSAVFSWVEFESICVRFAATEEFKGLERLAMSAEPVAFWDLRRHKDWI